MEDDEITALIAKGKLNEIKNRIVNSKWTNSKTLTVLISLSRAVAQNDNFLHDNVFELANCCCSNLSMKDSEKDKFLLSLYHIIKYLCKKQLFQNAQTLLEYSKKYCVDTSFKSDMYTYYITLFHNNFLQNTQNLGGDVIFNIISYSVQMHLLMKNLDFTIFISRLKMYFSLFRCNTLSETHRAAFSTQVLQLFENITDKNDLFGLYKMLLYILINCTISITSSKDENSANNLQKIYVYTCKIMKKHFIDKEYVECTEIFELITQSIIKNINNRHKKDVDMLIDCNKKLRTLIRKRGTNSVVMYSCSMLSKILRILYDYFHKEKQFWNEHFPVTLQTELVRLIEILCPYLLKSTENIEKCCKECNFNTDIINSASLSNYGIVFINMSLKSNMSCSEDFKILSLKVVELCCKIFKQQKDNNCEKYISFWRMVGAGMYNTAVISYKNKDFIYSKLFCELFIKNVILLEGTENPELCFSNSLASTLHLYAVNCQNLEERNECLLYLCLTMLLSQEYKKKAFQSWIVLKSSMSDDTENIKTKTLYQILYNEQNAIKKIYSNYEYNAEICENLLMEELQNYCDIWKSKIPLKSLCKDLCLISKNVLNRTKCFALTWEKLNLVDPNFLDYVEDTIKMAENSKNTNSKTCLAVLYFIQYQCKMNEIYNKNIKDMNEAYMPLKSTPLQPYEEPPNPNDKCDIVPSFYSMNIDNLINIFSILDKCYDIWNELSQSKHLDEDIASKLNILSFIKLLAFEFRLQLFNTKMIGTWFIYYRFCHKLNNKEEIISSIGFIIEYTDIRTKYIKSLTEEAEILIKSLDLKNPQHLEIYLTYFINKSYGCYKNDELENGVTAFKNAEKYLEEAKSGNLKICEARIWSLKTTYLMMPCGNKIMKHNENALITAQNAYTIIGDHYLSSSRCPYLTSLVFEISLSNGWMYKWLCLPREARCYTKDCVFLAQKLVIPLQTGHFLSLLAFVDLLDLQYGDCEVKLNGLTNMLCYTSNITYEKKPAPMDKVFKEEDSKITVYEMEDFESIPIIQTALDVPIPHRTNNLLMSSPELKKRKFVLPEFMKHADNCECFMCSNCEYQNLILDTMHLEALLTFYQNIGDLGGKCFQGGYSVLQKILKKSDRYFYKLITLNKEIIPACLYKHVSQNKLYFLLNFSYYLLNAKQFERATKILDKITLMLSKKHNVYLWQELMIQRLNIKEFEQQEIEEKENKLKENKKENNLQVPSNNVQVTTPENKVSKPNIHLSVSPVALKPKKTFKKLKFDLSDDEKDEKSKTPVKNFPFKFQSESSKTPAPAAKIKIYTPKTVKPKRTAPKVTKPEPTCPQSESKKGLSKQLEERTKLLTEKLKAEKKTVKIPEDLKKEKAVRKNLLDDLDDVTQSVDKLTIKENKNIKKEDQKKKYTRIKLPSSSSSDSSDSLRKSTRIRKKT